MLVYSKFKVEQMRKENLNVWGWGKEVESWKKKEKKKKKEVAAIEVLWNQAVLCPKSQMKRNVSRKK